MAYRSSLTIGRVWSAAVMTVVGIAAVTAASKAGAQRQLTAPEAFTSPMQVRSSAAAAVSMIRVQIDRYTSDADRKTMAEALTHGGYPNFLQALRKAPAVGHVEVAGRKFTLRWTRAQPTPKGGRTITAVTDAPVYFVGGGSADAKPRAGFEIAVVQLSVDDLGYGNGTIAAAARVKPDGAGGVAMEDYAEQPIKLTFVRRELS